MKYLNKIIRAGNRIADREATFSCTALDAVGLPDTFSHRYWVVMMGRPAYTLEQHMSGLEGLPECFWESCIVGAEAKAAGDQRCREIRLMMLAWLHEMVRDGQFDSLTSSK